ncbi:hypothetical protein L1887_23729 [Cichorium endivia]|nr:hypothetical protein L1887_23729 [Cichorium endivia]
MFGKCFSVFQLLFQKCYLHPQVLFSKIRLCSCSSTHVWQMLLRISVFVPEMLLASTSAFLQDSTLFLFFNSCLANASPYFSFCSRNVTCIHKCFSPRFDFVLVLQLMFGKCFSVFPFLFLHFTTIHIIVDGYNDFPSSLIRVWQMLLQSPQQIHIVFREYNDGYL